MERGRKGWIFSKREMRGCEMRMEMRMGMRMRITELIAFSDCFCPNFSCRRKLLHWWFDCFQERNNAFVCLFKGVARWEIRLFFFFFFILTCLCSQWRLWKHSILSTYIDTHRVVLTNVCSMKKLSAWNRLLELKKNHTVVYASSRCKPESTFHTQSDELKEILLQAADSKS